MERENILKNKSIQFEKRIYFATKFIKENKKEYSLSDQLFRSGTSIAANVVESDVAQSKNDFASKIGIALKEAKETEFWLKLSEETNLLSKKESYSLNEDCTELIKILVKIRQTLRSR